MSIDKKYETYLEHAIALRDTMRVIYETDTSNVWRFSSFKTFIRKYHQILHNVKDIITIEGILDIYNIDKIPGPMDTIGMQQKDLFDGVFSNVSLLISILKQKVKYQENEIINLRNFLQSNLRKAVLQEPQRETDIQDVIEQLFIGRGLTKGIDYDREKGRVKVSIKEVVPDFIIPTLNLAIEVKLTKNASKSKKIVDEVNADIQAYSKQYENVLFVIYDFGSIRDEEEFKNDIDNRKNIIITIVKH